MAVTWRRRAIIIGAGPAGLAVGYELLARTDIEPFVLEQDGIVGSLSRTRRSDGQRHRGLTSRASRAGWNEICCKSPARSSPVPALDTHFAVPRRIARIAWDHEP